MEEDRVRKELSQIQLKDLLYFSSLSGVVDLVSKYELFEPISGSTFKVKAYTSIADKVCLNVPSNFDFCNEEERTTCTET